MSYHAKNKREVKNFPTLRETFYIGCNYYNHWNTVEYPLVPIGKIRHKGIRNTTRIAQKWAETETIYKGEDQ